MPCSIATDLAGADARWRWISWGSVAAALLWLLVSTVFSWYASHFGSYNKTYGSLGAVIAFMVWSWLSATFVLLGGESNAETSTKTAHPAETNRSARAEPRWRTP